MKREWKIRLIIMSIFTILLIGGFLLMKNSQIIQVPLEDKSVKGIVSASSFNPEDTREIGYELLDDAKVVHIWNIHDDYFFNKSSGIQFTNHFQEYWTRNVFCIGYYNNDEWNKIKCADELNDFNRNIQTDDETYVNATLWKDITYSGYNIRLGIQYHLKLEDGELSITVYAKNIGTDIPYDLGFAWKIKDVDIPGVTEDTIYINDTEYDLDGTYDLLLKGLTEPTLEIHNEEKFLWMDWKENLTYAVKMYANGNQEDFYTMLLVNAGHFNPNQEKSTTLHWIDADTQVESSPNTDTHHTGLFGPYWINTTHGVLLFVDSGNDMRRQYTNDGGSTWTGTDFEAGTVEHSAAWFDQETPGNSGTIVHVAWLDSGSDVLYYITLYANNNSLGTKRTAASGLTVSTYEYENRIGITKTLSGNVVVCYSTATETDCLKSNDNFATSGTSISDIVETPAQEDWFLLFPANTGDDNDVAGVFWDGSADEISLKMYDDNEDSWTESLVNTSMMYQQQLILMDGAVRHSDNHILLTAHTYVNNAANDLMTCDITPDSISSPTITAKSNVFTNYKEALQVAIIINQQNDDVYISPLKGADFLNTVDVVFYKSTDDMSNWGSEQAYSEVTDDYRAVHGGRTVGNDGGRIQWVWYDDDSTDLWVNLVNDIEIKPPLVVSNVFLNATNINNQTTENLTIWFDLLGGITSITDWRINGTSIAVLNMPFDTDKSGDLSTDAIGDYSTFGNNGTLGEGVATYSPTWTSSGKVGGAYVFDGINDSIKDSDFPFISPPFTISAWVKDPYHSTNGAYITIVAKGGVFDDDTNFVFGIRTTTGAYRPHLFWYNGATLYGNEDSDDSVSPTGWTHIVGVVDSSYDLTIYLNGSNTMTDSDNLVPTDGSQALTIGNWTGTKSTQEYFNGTIDELMIFDYSLSQEQVQAMYQAGVANHSVEIMVNQDTNLADNWTVAVTPNDATRDGITILSNNVFILPGELPPPTFCASYSAGTGEYYVPQGCECYYQGAEMIMNLSKFSCIEP